MSLLVIHDGAVVWFCVAEVYVKLETSQSRRKTEQWTWTRRPALNMSSFCKSWILLFH